jgi:hypothetical protein
MNKRSVALLAGSMLSLLCVCRHGEQQKETIAKVGSTSITQQDLDAYNTVARYMPSQPEEFSLTGRAGISAILEIEAIYKKAHGSPKYIKIRHSDDWKWKERYFISLQYSMEILQANLGYSVDQLKAFYNSHKDLFKQPVQFDSTGKAKKSAAPVVRPFDEVRAQVIQKLFCSEHKPDSVFMKRIDTAEAKDSNIVQGRWIEYIRANALRDYFLKQCFKEKYGKPYPDSLKDLYGNDKILSPADMDVILSWIPEYQRKSVKENPQRLMDFCQWLMKWKLFAEKAVETGYADQPTTKNLLDWAWKTEVAQRYVNEKMVPAAKVGIQIDTAMALYSYWDESGNPGQKVDTAGFRAHIGKLVQQEVNANFEKLIYELRQKAGIKFIQTGLKDEKTNNPVALLKTADSLRDTGSTNEAENRYRILVNNFAYTPEGKKAMVELAKVQTEQQSYLEAIKNYRRFLVIDADKSKQCNTMFMIGFIYDEYLDKPDMAEINYKWVLKNAPECELADDAEFMMLHLGEQMASVDELQAEVKRQGKKVEATETDSTGLKVETKAVAGKPKHK